MYSLVAVVSNNLIIDVIDRHELLEAYLDLAPNMGSDLVFFYDEAEDDITALSRENFIQTFVPLSGISDPTLLLQKISQPALTIVEGEYDMAFWLVGVFNHQVYCVPVGAAFAGPRGEA